MPDENAKIIIAASHSKLTKVRDTLAVEDTINALTCQFVFRTSDWDNTVKTATFVKGWATPTTPSEDIICVLLDADNECVVPPEVLDDKGLFSVGVFGVADNYRIPSNWMFYKIADGCYAEGSSSLTPTPSVYEQILIALNSKSNIGHTHNYVDILNKPTTLEGYGITDAYTQNEVDEILSSKADEYDLIEHISDVDNPHAVTKIQVGLGNVDNTEDINKPISIAQQAALNEKLDVDVVGALAFKSIVEKEDLSQDVQNSLSKADAALQSETDPTVPEWAKQPIKPTYTYNEIQGTPPEIDLSDYATKEYVDNKGANYTIQKIQNYLYYINYDQLNYENGIEFCLNRFNPVQGACSAIRKGNFYGRNYDWYYDENATFIIDRKATSGKFASIGVASGLITNEVANSGEYNELYDYLPFITLDGINENGVVCNINVLPELDAKGHTTGTNPGQQDVPMACLVRCILDDAVSADDAIYKIRHNYNIIAPNSESVSSEMHFMIADSEKTYVVEFVDNEPVIIDTFVDDKPIMTNFYLDGYDGTRESLTPYAMGVERFGILSNGFESVASVDDMHNLMQAVLYTNAYLENVDPIWYSEFSGQYTTYGDLTKDSTPEEYAPLMEYVRGLFANRERDGKTWQTVHSVAYDIDRKELTISVQEEAKKYKFKLDVLGDLYIPDMNEYQTKSIVDTGSYFTSDTVEGALQELGEKISETPSGTTNHTNLTNRDAADQHPMSAITGLSTAIGNLQPKVLETGTLSGETVEDGMEEIVQVVSGAYESISSLQQAIQEEVAPRLLPDAERIENAGTVLVATGSQWETADEYAYKEYTEDATIVNLTDVAFHVFDEDAGFAATTSISVNMPEMLPESSSYTVTWDGTEYPNVYFDEDNIYLGNPKFVGGEDNGKPFCYAETLTKDGVTYKRIWLTDYDEFGDNTHSITVVGDANIIHKFSEKYIPNGNVRNGVGIGSVESGDMSVADGTYSIANGLKTKATGDYSIADGERTTASGYVSHADGVETTASGDVSHADGVGTTASGNVSHADGVDTVAKGLATHADGYGTIAGTTPTDDQSVGYGAHAGGRYNIEDTAGEYADIIGNGDGDQNRSNAYALGWDGSAHFAGDVYVGCNDDSSGGTKLAKEKPYLSLERVSRYLYNVTFKDVAADTETDSVPGSCSSYVLDGSLYRNLDLPYDNKATFHVYLPDMEGLAVMDGLTDTTLDDALIAQLPYHMTDGRNENGIMVSTHVLFNDWGTQYSGSVPLTKLPYLVLKLVKSMATIETDLADVLTDLKTTPALDAAGYLLQVLVTDGTTTYCLSPMTDGTTAYEVIDITENPKLTNFLWVNAETVDRADLQTRPNGVERWNMMPYPLSDLRFTAAYESPDRLSEFIGIDGTTKDSTDAELTAIYETAHATYLDRERGDGTWQTMHSVVYSHEKGIEHLWIQENWGKDYSGCAEMTGASSESDGIGGSVPKPIISDREKFLRGDGTWALPQSGSSDHAELTGRDADNQHPMSAITGLEENLGSLQSKTIQDRYSYFRTPTVEEALLQLGGKMREWDAKQSTSDMVSEINESSTTSQYPSAAAVRDYFNGIFLVSVSSANSEFGTVNSVTGLYTKGETVTVVATPRNGYQFVKWVDGHTGAYVSNQQTYQFDANKNTNLVAQFISSSIEIVPFSTGTDAQLAAIISAADNGVISLSDVWSIGDTRTVHLSAIAADPDLGDAHAAQDVEFTIMDFECEGLVLDIYGKRPNAVIGLKDCLNTTGSFDTLVSNRNNWRDCKRRTWCNGAFANALPPTFKTLFKNFGWYSGDDYLTSDLFALPPEFSVFGATHNARAFESRRYKQWPWYKTTSHQTKKVGSTGGMWWLGSSAVGTTTCAVSGQGDPMVMVPFIDLLGLAPFGCV